MFEWLIGTSNTDLYPPFAAAFPELLVHGKAQSSEMKGLGSTQNLDSVLLPSLKLKIATFSASFKHATLLKQELCIAERKYGLNVIGYWVPNDDPNWQNTIIYLIAHPSRAAAEKNCQAFHAGPAFLASRRAAAPLIEKANNEYRVDEVYMRPTDFSAIK